jgi:hypothetical protein
VLRREADHKQSDTDNVYGRKKDFAFIALIGFPGKPGFALIAATGAVFIAVVFIRVATARALRRSAAHHRFFNV